MSLAPEIKVEVSPETERAFRITAKEFPRETARGFFQQAPLLRKKLLASLIDEGGRGVPDYAPRQELTALLNPSKTLGGKLAEPFAVRFQNLRQSHSLTVGWVRSMERLAETFQQSETRQYTLGERRMIRGYFGRIAGRRSRRLDRKANDMIREGYRRPARPVIRPFAEFQAPLVWAEVIKRAKRKAAQTAKAASK